MVGFCEVEKMGKDYKVKEIDLSGVKFNPGKYYYIDSFSKKLTEFDIYEFRGYYGFTIYGVLQIESTPSINNYEQN